MITPLELGIHCSEVERVKARIPLQATTNPIQNLQLSHPLSWSHSSPKKDSDKFDLNHFFI